MDMSSPTRRRFLQLTAATAGGWLVSSHPVAARIQAAPRVRKEVRALTANELDRFRTAHRKLQDTVGAGGYADLAGMHGVSKHYCPHHSPLFLPWHRAYLLAFEDALRTIDPTITLPYWDWTSQDSIQQGIPPAFADQTYMTGGQTLANPLYSAKIPAKNAQTVRNPMPPALLAALETQVGGAYANTTFLTFSSGIEQPHDNLHGWVGGDMGVVDWSAYDPVFWAHHASIDRFWAQWQRGVNNADPLGGVLDVKFVPFSKTVADVLDFEKMLNYTYAPLTPMPARKVVVQPAVVQPELTPVEGAHFRKASLDFDPTKEHLVLVAHFDPKAEGSYNFFVYVNDPEVVKKEKHPVVSEKLLGFFTFFGHEKPPEKHEHDKMEKRPETEEVLLLSGPVADLIKKKVIKAGAENTLTIVATDTEGKRVPLEKTPLKGISISRRKL